MICERYEKVVETLNELFAARDVFAKKKMINNGC